VSPSWKGQQAVKRVLEAVKIEYRPIALHSMVKAMLLAEGAGQIYWRSPWSDNEWVWDIAPIALIVGYCSVMAGRSNSQKVGSLSDLSRAFSSQIGMTLFIREF
jgi:3'-phosphoadenosine 5'-phosphosulfate (PAPS) 3'-phosphatase